MFNGKHSLCVFHSQHYLLIFVNASLSSCFLLTQGFLICRKYFYSNLETFSTYKITVADEYSEDKVWKLLKMNPRLKSKTNFQFRSTRVAVSYIILSILVMIASTVLLIVYKKPNVIPHVLLSQFAVITLPAIFILFGIREENQCFLYPQMIIMVARCFIFDILSHCRVSPFVSQLAAW
jgi:hypothetical protein